MSDEFDDYPVDWLGAEACERSASAQRTLLGVGDGPLPHIMEVLELARNHIPQASGLELVARPDEMMGRAHAFANSQEREIIARQTIVEGAIDDAPLSRFVIVHELEHIVHHPGRKKFRVVGGNERKTFIDDGHSTEWQADMTTRAMFMPPPMVWDATSPCELANTARVPLDEAKQRFRHLRASKNLQTEQKRQFVRLPEPANDFDALRLRLWNGLPAIPGEDPALLRRCGIFRVSWLEYGKTSQCGWFLERGQIVAHFGRLGRG